MSTKSSQDNISTVLFGKTRRAILSLLFSHSEESFYLRQIERSVGIGLGAVQRELKNLNQVGIITRTVQGNQVYFQANPDCPIFEELKGLIMKTAGAVEILRSALEQLSDKIEIACIYGSIARGNESRNSDIDVLIVGQVTFADVINRISPVQNQLGREINPTVYPVAEFQSKLEAKHRFLTDVIQGSLVYLIGDKNELERLAKKQLAG